MIKLQINFKAEILQIFELLIWKIYAFINSFWLYLTFNIYWNVTSERMLPLYAIHWAASGVLQLHSCHSSDYKFLWLGLFSFPWTCRKTRPMKMTLECTLLVSMYVFLFSIVKKFFYKEVKEIGKKWGFQDGTLYA